jgi:hypothetical protein
LSPLTIHEHLGVHLIACFFVEVSVEVVGCGHPSALIFLTRLTPSGLQRSELHVLAACYLDSLDIKAGWQSIEWNFNRGENVLEECHFQLSPNRIKAAHCAE